MTAEVITFGCRLNTYESEVIRNHLRATGQKDVVVVNSCAVTAEAERQVRQKIRQLKREQPNHRIIVTGCGAQVFPSTYTEMPEVSRVLGNQEKLEKQSYQDFDLDRSEKALVNDIMSIKETAGHLITGMEGKARAFIQIQNGCNHRCTFCIIPYGRGNSRSVPIGDIVAQVRTLVEAGYKEIVFTGVDITDYGLDLPGQPTLGQMMRRVLRLVPELPRLRLSSIDAAEVDDDVYGLIATEPRLMPHIHLSLQSGDDMVLKRMKRRHLRDDIISLCTKIRELRPDTVFGADIIAGFPTETDAMFENTLNLVNELELLYLHVFPYSIRPSTPAAKMPQVPGPVKKQRATRLRKAGEKNLQGYLQTQKGKTHHVLMETETTGRTEHFAPVQYNYKARPGDLITMIMTSTTTHQLHGTPTHV